MAQNSQRLSWSPEEVDARLKNIMKECYDVRFHLFYLAFPSFRFSTFASDSSNISGLNSPPLKLDAMSSEVSVLSKVKLIFLTNSNYQYGFQAGRLADNLIKERAWIEMCVFFPFYNDLPI